MKPTVSVDKQIRAAYVRFSRCKVARTVSVSKDQFTFVDEDKTGGVVGVELLDLQSCSKRSILRHAKDISEIHRKFFPYGWVK